MVLNLKGNDQYTYDAIVVGSGISGGWAAKELCEKGLKVLMLERGMPLQHPDYPTATKDPWEFPYCGSLTQEDKTKSFVQARHYSFREDNKHFYINDLENPYTEIKRFDWIRGDVVGGRSLLWARQCYRLSDLDFEANVKDGHGIDWPVRYRDLEPWYEYVESFIGVSGQEEGIQHLPDGKFLPPMEMNCAEKDFKSRLNKTYSNRYVTIGRSANLTQPVKGRGQCQNRNLCHRGCPYGAYFSTNASTLPAAFATGNLTLRPHSLVDKVLYDDQKGKATGIEITDTETNEVLQFHSRIIFLNASTVATAYILLNSTSRRFPNGMGNGSDQVGRNLMDHHKHVGASASVEGFEDQYYTGRRPNGIYVPRFRNITEKRSDYLRGFGYQGGASRDDWHSDALGTTIGGSLKKNLQTPGPWNISFTGFGECLPYSENRVTLNPDKKDKWGRPTLNIDAEFKDNEKAMRDDMRDAMGEMLEALGYKNVKTYMNSSFPGNANHEMGTARMGHDPRTSVLNAFNQMHEVKNVFITDGAAMTSSSCVNPSLTYMALTARACDYAIKELNRLNI
ncbi:MAG: GMC family oxidoreductase [Cyclobacteriaceae bacterium]|nr:GMC family oxidoreductase [Cyclobacteriaceae bacterium]MDH5247874.1 GMC family oxidoreductase [Cyclobacteriaceae bacterium]